MPEKPMELRVYESRKRMGLAFTGGGFDEQPYMLMMIDELVENEVAIFTAINKKPEREQ